MHWYASYVPIIREVEILVENGEKHSLEKIESAFELITLMSPGDHLWLMMGSTNAPIALAAFRKGVIVHQLSLARAQRITSEKESEQEDDKSPAGRTGRRTKISPEEVMKIAKAAPHLFYPVTEAQSEVLEIATAWQQVNDLMERRKSAANSLRARLIYEAVVTRRIRGIRIPSDPKEAKKTVEVFLETLLSTKDADGRKREPGDPLIAWYTRQEEEARSRLEKICHSSKFYTHLFGTSETEGVGPNIGARFISAIERIERFEKPEDLSNYAGMLPRGKEGKLPSRKRSRGKILSRSPELNNACFLLQEHMFQWGRNTWLGQMLNDQVLKECPCTQEQRKQDKDLRRKHGEAVVRARISMSRYFLEKIVWPRWREYMGLPT